MLSELTVNLRSGYHRDLQLTKEAVFQSFDTCLELLQATGYVIENIEVNEEGDNFKIRTDTDNQLNYAIKLLNG